MIIESVVSLQFSCKHQINYSNKDCIQLKRIPSPNIQVLLHTGVRSTDGYKLKPEYFEDNYLKVKMNKTGDFLHVPILIMY